MTGHAAAVRHLRKADPRMAAVIRMVGPCQFQATGGRFEVLARSILSQQISVSAARTIYTRLRRQMPSGRLSACGIDALSDNQLQTIGISHQKRSYLRDLTGRTLNGQLKFRRLPHLPDDDVIEELTEVKGIGVWTAQMFLMFGLGRPNVFAPGDLGLKNAVEEIYGTKAIRSHDAMQETAATWAPWKSVASWYLWRFLELDADSRKVIRD